MPTVQRTAIVQGTPYLHDVGVNAGDSLGNSSQLTVNASFNKVALDRYTGEGGKDDVYYEFDSGTVELNVYRVSLAMLQTALGATSVAVPASQITAEPHTVVATGKLIALDHVQDMDQPLVVKEGATVFVEGTHYTRVRAGIIPITGAVGGIVAADALTFDYDVHPHQVMQALVNTILEKGLLYDGVNKRSNSPWRFDFHRIGWSPSETLELIGKEFMSFKIKGEILAYDGITNPAESKFYRAMIGDL